jgi:hypothetical protein
MSRYKPGLDDDVLVGQALEALAEATDDAEAPAAVEARLRQAFRASHAATTAPVAPVAPVAPRRASAWKWIATVGAAAGLVWLAYASLRTAPKPAAREEARVEPRGAAASPALSTVAPAPAVAPAHRSSVATADAPRTQRPRRTRPAPTVERFEPLYPGDVLADLDAVHLVRVSVPRSALATLGWPARPGTRDRVELDAMVGPDGVTRAVRFISQ